MKTTEELRQEWKVHKEKLFALTSHNDGLTTLNQFIKDILANGDLEFLSDVAKDLNEDLKSRASISSDKQNLILNYVFHGVYNQLIIEHKNDELGRILYADEDEKNPLNIVRLHGGFSLLNENGKSPLEQAVDSKNIEGLEYMIGYSTKVGGMRGATYPFCAEGTFDGPSIFLYAVQEKASGETIALLLNHLDSDSSGKFADEFINHIHEWVDSAQYAEQLEAIQHFLLNKLDNDGSYESEKLSEAQERINARITAMRIREGRSAEEVYEYSQYITSFSNESTRAEIMLALKERLSGMDHVEDKSTYFEASLKVVRALFDGRDQTEEVTSFAADLQLTLMTSMKQKIEKLDIYEEVDIYLKLKAWKSVIDTNHLKSNVIVDREGFNETVKMLNGKLLIAAIIDGRSVEEIQECAQNVDLNDETVQTKIHNAISLCMEVQYQCEKESGDRSYESPQFFAEYQRLDMMMSIVFSSIKDPEFQKLREEARGKHLFAGLTGMLSIDALTKGLSASGIGDDSTFTWLVEEHAVEMVKRIKSNEVYKHFESVVSNVFTKNQTLMNVTEELHAVMKETEERVTETVEYYTHHFFSKKKGESWVDDMPKDVKDKVSDLDRLIESVDTLIPDKNQKLRKQLDDLKVNYEATKKEIERTQPTLNRIKVSLNSIISGLNAIREVFGEPPLEKFETMQRSAKKAHRSAIKETLTEASTTLEKARAEEVLRINRETKR